MLSDLKSGELPHPHSASASGGAIVNIAIQRNRVYINMLRDWEMRQQALEHILKRQVGLKPQTAHQ